MTEIKRIGVLSLAKIVGLIYLVFGLVMWLFMGCFLLIGLIAQPTETPLEMMVIIGFFCFLPVLYGVMGFIGGAIIAVIYNAIAGKIGGIELELVPVVVDPEITIDAQESL